MSSALRRTTAAGTKREMLLHLGQRLLPNIRKHLWVCTTSASQIPPLTGSAVLCMSARDALWYSCTRCSSHRGVGRDTVCALERTMLELPRSLHAWEDHCDWACRREFQRHPFCFHNTNTNSVRVSQSCKPHESAVETASKIQPRFVELGGLLPWEDHRCASSGSSFQCPTSSKSVIAECLPPHTSNFFKKSSLWSSCAA